MHQISYDSIVNFPVPTVPQALKEAEATTTTITISWQASEGSELMSFVLRLLKKSSFIREHFEVRVVFELLCSQ